jgi:hypothetical protein
LLYKFLYLKRKSVQFGKAERKFRSEAIPMHALLELLPFAAGLILGLRGSHYRLSAIAQSGFVIGCVCFLASGEVFSTWWLALACLGVDAGTATVGAALAGFARRSFAI